MCNYFKCGYFLLFCTFTLSLENYMRSTCLMALNQLSSLNYFHLFGYVYLFFGEITFAETFCYTLAPCAVLTATS